MSLPVRPERFKEKAVRDLAWLLTSPALLTPATGLQLLIEAPHGKACSDGALAASVAERTAAWLEALDADPAVFLEDLRGQTNVRRLGFYASALTEYWLREGPGWGTERLLSAVPLTAADDACSKRTTGQLKFVCRRPSEVLHVESSLKFFIDAAPANSALANSGNPMARFVGPFLHENFAWRLAEARRKLRSTSSASVQEFLQREFGKVPVRSAYFLKGYIFRPLVDFRPPAPWCTPDELNASCSVGWYTSSLEELSNFLSPHCRVAVLPKLFWMGPAKATGEPPLLCGSPLPNQHEPVPVELWADVKDKIAFHFQHHDHALLLCELAPLTRTLADTESQAAWTELSRGFFLPPNWDPQALLTDGPTGMRATGEGRALQTFCDGFADSRGRFADRFADSLRSTPPDLTEALVRGVGQVPELLEGRELAPSDLLRYVVSGSNAGSLAENGDVNDANERKGGVEVSVQQGDDDLDNVGGAQPKAPLTRQVQKAGFRVALRAAEGREPGAACRLVCATLEAVAQRGLRTAGHALLELLWREAPLPKAEMEPLFHLCSMALQGQLYPRLVLRMLSCFGAVPKAVSKEVALEAAATAMASGDRARLAGTMELLAASASLPGAELLEQLPASIELIAAPPADAATLESMCRAAPSLCLVFAERLAENGQLRLARRITKWAASQQGSSGPSTTLRRRGALAAAPQGGASNGHLPLVSLPSSVRVVFVENENTLAEVHARMVDGCVIGVDAEWRPRVRNRKDVGATGGDLVDSLDCLKVQLLQLAWPDAVYVLDLPALQGKVDALSAVLRRLLHSGDGPLAVGYGFEGDMKHIADSYPEHASKVGPWRGVELRSLCTSATGMAAGVGLSQMCAAVLGHRLDKELQCSDWAQRPLSSQQLYYAALDAWVLLPLLGRLCGVGGCEKVLLQQDLADLRECASARAETFPSLAEHGAAAVVVALERLHADPGRARLVRSAEAAPTGEPCAAVSCKALACVWEAKGHNSSVDGPSLRYLLCLLPTQAEADFDALASALSTPTAQGVARLASAEELLQIFQQTRGHVGPLGPALPPGAAVVMDCSLLEAPLLACGAGAPGWQLCVSPSYLRELTSAVLEDVVTHRSPGAGAVK